MKIIIHKISTINNKTTKTDHLATLIDSTKEEIMFETQDYLSQGMGIVYLTELEFVPGKQVLLGFSASRASKPPYRYKAKIQICPIDKEKS